MFIHCNNKAPFTQSRPSPKPMDWLLSRGICIDQLRPELSTIQEGAGRGAFTSKFTAIGNVVVSSPVLHFDKREMIIMEQSIGQKYDEINKIIYNATKVRGEQLLTNYLFGHPNSSIVLLPTASHVNLINHSPKSNVGIRWGSKYLLREYFNMTPSTLFMQPIGLIIDYVALRDIQPGEELFLDYGSEWQHAWENHVDNWQPVDASYITASDYTKLHGDDMIRTVAEQETTPYPNNLQTVCSFVEWQDETADEKWQEDSEIVWDNRHDECLRPCVITERNVDEGVDVYTAIMYPSESHITRTSCRLVTTQTPTVSNIPRQFIMLADKTYSTDQHLPHAFRHIIGVPSTLYPEIWMDTQLSNPPAFVSVPLKPSELSQIKWLETNKPVSDYAFRVGLDPNIAKALLDYCNLIGITDAFKHHLIEGNPLKPGSDRYTLFGDYNWYIQRPESHWKSNMHWISPGDEAAHEDYLRVLSAGGFDNILSSIGNHFGLDGLVAYHVTFIGVSHCSKGYMHHDFRGIDGKAFNIIIPLILANETGPEFDLRQDGDESDDGNLAIGSYKYEPNVASMVGDMAKHATAACDYRDTKEMRMAATIYIADVNERNLDALMVDFTQAFPPVDNPEYLLSRAGSHWKTDGSVKLPLPFIAKDMTPIIVGEISPMKWEAGTLTKYADRIGLPLTLVNELKTYSNRMGISTYYYEAIVEHDALKPGQGQHEVFRGYQWTGQRSKVQRWNLHWLSPSDEAAHNNLLGVLSAAGFDETLERIGRYYELDSLTVYSVAFMGLSRNSRRVDRIMPHSGGKIFKVIVPLIMAQNAGPEMEFWSDTKETMGPYHFEKDVGLILGDGAIHSIAKCYNRDKEEEMQVAVQILLGDIREVSVNSLLETIEFQYRSDDNDHFLQTSEIHWNKVDTSKRLPKVGNSGDFVTQSIQPNQISQFRWLGNGKSVAEYAFRLGLPERLSKALLEYCHRTGITNTFRKLVIDGEPLVPGQHRFDQYGGYEWYVQRPDNHWKSNMHWISPANEDAHQDYLRVLSDGGFDDILNSIGSHFKLDGLVAYHVTFIAVSKCDKGYVHYDFHHTEGRAFNIIIPLILANSTGPELDIQQDGTELIGSYKYELNVASMVGDVAFHATAAVDYLDKKEMRMAATVYIADLNSRNIGSIMNDFTQAYPPKGDFDYLMKQAGTHWSPTAKDKRLPVPIGGIPTVSA